MNDEIAYFQATTRLGTVVTVKDPDGFEPKVYRGDQLLGILLPEQHGSRLELFSNRRLCMLRFRRLDGQNGRVVLHTRNMSVKTSRSD